MKREIKFRGKGSDGKWYHGNSLINTKTGCSIVDFDDNYYNVYSETVGQFTGLHDKNGKKIYEGDIVKTGRVNQYVFFSKGNFVLELGDYLSDCYKNIEVVGNIHDNKELLKTE